MKLSLNLTGADLTKATPREIDADLYLLYVEMNRLQARSIQAQNEVKYYQSGRGKNDFRAEEYMESAIAKVDALSEQMEEVSNTTKPYTNEFKRRGGWTRAYLVNNSNGHVHNSMACSTCNNGNYATDFIWMTDYSAKDEAEIVEAAGERACTVCYASAPADTWNRTTKMFTPDEVEAAKARTARADKRATAEKAMVLDPKTGKMLFKTARGATNYIASELSSLTWYGMGHPSAQEWVKGINDTLEALKAKGEIADDDSYYTEALAKARKKTNRENSGGSKF